jgi:hypothetical protein
LLIAVAVVATDGFGQYKNPNSLQGRADFSGRHQSGLSAEKRRRSMDPGPGCLGPRLL